MSRRGFWLGAALLVLVLAGVVSGYASSHPDGLEFVAEATGFGHQAQDSATADSPLADYRTRGIDDGRVSGGVAGILGTVLVAGLAGGLFWAVRRRPDRDPTAGQHGA